MEEELLYQVALTMAPHIGNVQAKILVQQFGSASAIFKVSIHQLEKVEGMGATRARAIKRFHDWDTAAAQVARLKASSLRTLFLSDEDYPRRLLNCYDPPTLLYYEGEASLNQSHHLGIIGTRHHSEYGRQAAEKLVADLQSLQVSIISGMAYGIDGVAHRAALKNGMTTIGVLAHGLDTIYPPEHAGLAREITRNKGALVTEFPPQTLPDKHHFPIRNRIVAGLCDAIVVVETGIKGGSMITAELANGYNRDVFAYPGRATDPKSSGCNQLIRQNKAILLNNASELLEWLGWNESPKSATNPQRPLFPELNPTEQRLVDLLTEKPDAHIDTLSMMAGIPQSAMAAALLSLEMNNIIMSLPGKRYRLL
ncbi:DNA-processing protein DprA [Flavihumibacter rivuli]|uniref:DNA-processing protein DprA n=1 Tax=Flavihumibacter rivuli TaxID=2838156 RepID=UPI001BDE5806|nr:DNA-processing protein DprA [Flavihumibacter rivuli]ULQ56775.1 DNA-processing protein DprA [Flavihumibacter rivuli]